MTTPILTPDAETEARNQAARNEAHIEIALELAERTGKMWRYDGERWVSGGRALTEAEVNAILNQ